jgi:hypothetical protein
MDVLSASAVMTKSPGTKTTASRMLHRPYHYYDAADGAMPAGHPSMPPMWTGMVLIGHWMCCGQVILWIDAMVTKTTDQQWLNSLSPIRAVLWEKYIPHLLPSVN